MERITILNRTTKNSGKIRLRFRLVDGRDVQLYHKSRIEADINDLKKFKADGTVKPKTSIFNKELHKEITEEIVLISNAYKSIIKQGLSKDSETLERLIEAELHPQSQTEEEPPLLSRFAKFIEDNHRDGVIGEGRLKHYRVTQRELQRFLIINKKSDIKADEFSDDMLMNYRHFLINEHTYVKNWQGLYVGLRESNIPTKARSTNTVSQKLSQLKAFFATLEDKEVIVKSPFRRLGKNKRSTALREEYDEPVYLNSEDFARVLGCEVPTTLQETKNAFVVQCALGCRIGDYKAMSMANIAVTNAGTPYVRYLPDKTKGKSKDAVETPLMLFALEIIKACGFKFGVLRYVSGKSGYNQKIKELLKCCGIDRDCKMFDREKNNNVYKPLYEFGSSKLCRKTHVDMMNKVQINQYIAGLHSKGSDAVNRYTSLSIDDRFVLMCRAFSQPTYRVDDNLNLI